MLWWQRLPGPHPFFVNPGIREFLWHEWSTQRPTNRMRVLKKPWCMVIRKPLQFQGKYLHIIICEKVILSLNKDLALDITNSPTIFYPLQNQQNDGFFSTTPRHVEGPGQRQPPPVQCPPAPPCRRAFQRHHAYHSTNDPLQRKTWVVGFQFG